MRREREREILPITPLTTLRTAQLFQMSCPRISSTDGNRNGSILGFSATSELEVVTEDSASEVEAMVTGTGGRYITVFYCINKT